MQSEKIVVGSGCRIRLSEWNPLTDAVYDLSRWLEDRGFYKVTAGYEFGLVGHNFEELVADVRTHNHPLFTVRALKSNQANRLVFRLAYQVDDERRPLETVVSPDELRAVACERLRVFGARGLREIAGFRAAHPSHGGPFTWGGIGEGELRRLANLEL